MSTINFQDLPYDVMLKILNQLGVKELGNLCQVNKKLYEISNDEFFWKYKYLHDIHEWRVLYSNTFQFTSHTDSFKNLYVSNCPDLVAEKEILKNLETFQKGQSTLHLNSTSDTLAKQSSLTLSALSVFGLVSNFISHNIFGSPPESNLSKIVMFGPGLETTTSCLVTKILWNSEFKTLGMIPGKDGYGSGIKLKLYNHKPFNLTILYTNVKKLRKSNKHNLEHNRLLTCKKGEQDELVYELQPQVKEACADATAFVYIIDNKHLKHLIDTNDMKEIDNYRFELNVLMKEVNKNLPLLILSCNTNQANDKLSKGMSCVNIVDCLDIMSLDREWSIRDCEIFQDKLKDVVLGFEWILNNVNNKNLMDRIKNMDDENS